VLLRLRRRRGAHAALRHFAAINGFSNQSYGWGGENADLYYRVIWIWGTFNSLDR
jgi:hypothetical protein